MRFDNFADDDGSVDLRVPDGPNECVISRTKEWTSPDGDRSALIVTFKPEDSQYDEFSRFFDPKDRRDCALAMSLSQWVGIQSNQGLGKNLEGRRVVAITKRGTKKNGEATVFVNGFAASGFEQEEPAAARSVSARTATQKADRAAAMPGDDIPF